MKKITRWWESKFNKTKFNDMIALCLYVCMSVWNILLFNCHWFIVGKIMVSFSKRSFVLVIKISNFFISNFPELHNLCEKKFSTTVLSSNTSGKNADNCRFLFSAEFSLTSSNLENRVVCQLLLFRTIPIAFF